MTPKTVLALATCLVAFALVGCGDNGTGSIVSPEDPIVADTVPPAVPTDMVVHALTRTVEVSWSENSEPDLAGYVLQRSFDGGSSWETLGGSLLTTASYTDARDYSALYRVAATDLSSNQSAFSNQEGYWVPTPKSKYNQKPAEQG